MTSTPPGAASSPRSTRRAIAADDGRVAWDLGEYGFLADETAPETVNPSLWRQARLNLEHGLFRIHERIWQVRGYDLSVMSVIAGDTGWIVVDPLISQETARASLALVNEHLGRAARWSR